LSLFCGVACARPIADVSGFARFGQEAPHFGCKIGLCCVERSPLRRGDIAFGDVHALGSSLLRCGSLFRRQLRRDLRRLRRTRRTPRSPGHYRNMRPLRCALNRGYRRRRRRNVEFQVRQRLIWNSIRYQARLRRERSHISYRRPRKRFSAGLLRRGASAQDRRSHAQPHKVDSRRSATRDETGLRHSRCHECSDQWIRPQAATRFGT